MTTYLLYKKKTDIYIYLTKLVVNSYRDCFAWSIISCFTCL